MCGRIVLLERGGAVARQGDDPGAFVFQVYAQPHVAAFAGFGDKDLDSLTRQTARAGDLRDGALAVEF